MLALVLAAAALLPQTGIAGRPAPEPRALPGWSSSSSADLGRIRRDVRDARKEGRLTRRQARELRREAREIGRLEERHAAGGLSEAERAELRSRVALLRALSNAKRLGTLR